MYYYIYDSYLSEKKYQKELAKLEIRLTDLGINGKIIRLSLLKSLKDMVLDEIRRGAKNIIIVGNDNTVNKVINFVAQFNDIVLGIIPIGRPNNIAKSLAIPVGEAACDVLSARRVKKIDLGRVNEQYFISNVSIKSPDVVLKPDNNLQIKPQGKNININIFNLNTKDNNSIPLSNPQDGILETLIEEIDGVWRKKHKNISFFPLSKLQIISKQPQSVLIDGQSSLNTPVNINVAKEKIKIITGKDLF